MKTMHRRYAAWSVLLLSLIAATAHANVGVPTLVVLWPPAIFLLIPIVWLEAGIAERDLHVLRGRARRAAIWSNLASTFLGIPFAGALLASFSFDLMEGDVRSHSLTARAASLAGIVFENRGSGWVLLLALCIATGTYAVTSILIEAPVAQLCLRDIPRQAVWRWAIKANVISYSILTGLIGLAGLVLHLLG